MSTDNFRRVHPLTPLLRFWTLILAILAGLALNINVSSWQAMWGFFSDDHDIAIWPFLASIGGFLLAGGVIWLLSRIWWKATGFRLTDEEIQHRRGVLNTQLRTARFDRIQAVDLVESVIARIFRVAAVRVETAGGGNSVIEIAFLKRAEANQLRKELIAASRGITSPSVAGPSSVDGNGGAAGGVIEGTVERQSGVLSGDLSGDLSGGPRRGPGAKQNGGQAGAPFGVPYGDPVSDPVSDLHGGPYEHHQLSEHGADAQQVVPLIPITRTLASAALSLSTIVLVLGLLVIALTPLGVTALIPFLAGLAPTVWNLIDKSWKFQAELRDDVLNVSYGLADRRRQSIPLARIHGVSVVQPLLWRPFGWWTVSVSVAGYGAETKQGGTTRLLPVGSRELALRLLEVVGPLTEGEITTHAQPDALTRPDYVSPPTAKWVSPLDRRQQGVTLLGEFGVPRAVVVHSGRLYHRMAVIEVSHIQELTLRRGPIQRVLGLSTVQLDLVPGPVAMQGSDLLYADGRQLVEVLRRRPLPEYAGPDAEAGGDSPDDPGYD